MARAAGTVRPGGRTAKTREAAHTAVRQLLGDGDSAVTMAAVAERSGVHLATLYRRWRTPEALILDVGAADVSSAFPIPATGHLAADLTAYTEHLVADLRRPGSLSFFRAIVSAAETGGLSAAQEFAAPRLDQFRAMLEADGAGELTPVDIFELVLAPVFMWALLTHDVNQEETIGPGPDVARIVENTLAVQTRRRQAAAPPIPAG